MEAAKAKMDGFEKEKKANEAALAPFKKQLAARDSKKKEAAASKGALDQQVKDKKAFED
jgi:hypothetical protein